jgi:Domain of unknown function (DUF4290)
MQEMNLDYNTQQPHLVIPEYGRNIQRMIEYCCTIQEREERNVCARAIISVMGQLNPYFKDGEDVRHKLWDHLFIISDFRLDVDSPYPLPSRETFQTKPEKVNYPSGNIRYKQYGKTVGDLIEKAKTYQEGDEKEELKRLIAMFMKRAYFTMNKENAVDGMILKHLSELSKGELEYVLDNGESLNIGSTSTGKYFNKNKHKSNSNNGSHKSNNFKNNNNKNRNFKRR